MVAAVFGSGKGLVKICGLRQPEDAVAAVAAGADLLGFVLAPSKRRVTPEQAAACVRAARSAASRPVVMVGVVVAESFDEIERAIAIADLDLIQLHRGEREDPVAWPSRPTVEALRPEPGAEVGQVVHEVAARGHAPNAPLAWLIDGYHPTAHGGTGTRADWSLAAAIAGQAPLILAGGLTPENVGDAIPSVRPLGVDVSSGVERGGAKDARLMAEFVRRARAAFDALPRAPRTPSDVPVPGR